MVDRYNIYFAYGSSKINKKIHATAVNFVIVGTVFCQLCMLFFSILRKGGEVTIYSAVGLSITGVIFIAQVSFNACTRFQPITYEVRTIYSLHYVNQLVPNQKFKLAEFINLNRELMILFAKIQFVLNRLKLLQE